MKKYSVSKETINIYHLYMNITVVGIIIAYYGLSSLFMLFIGFFLPILLQSICAMFQENIRLNIALHK